MRSERVLTRPLVVFLAVVVALLLRAANQRVGPKDLTTALRILSDGDIEGAERRRLLATVRQEALGKTDPAQRLCALMAAVALGNQDAVARALPDNAPLLDPLEPLWSDVEARVPALVAASLGDPVLKALLEAALAEHQGQRKVAAFKYGQVVASSQLFHMSVAGWIAKDCVDRLR